MGLRRACDQSDVAELAVMEAGGLRPSDVVQVKVSNLNDGIRAVPEGKVDASFTAVGIGVIEEANAMEPIRFLGLRNIGRGQQNSRPNTVLRSSSLNQRPASREIRTSSAIRFN